LKSSVAQPSLVRERETSIAILVPCYNEALTIAAVIADFKKVLPAAAIYVYDNNSSDDTELIALAAGAIVRREPLQGKGHVMRRMFADIEADVYVMVDGDDTYDAVACVGMIERLIENRLDLVNGKRVPVGQGTYRAGHQFGNWFLSTATAKVFGNRVDDMLSGLKVMSRRYVKSFPCLATGFEIETEMTIHALELQMPVDEMPVSYRERRPGSQSKLNTIRDGFRILWLILALIRAERPTVFFGAVFAVLALPALALGISIYIEYLQTHLVLRFPTAILCTGMMLLAFLSAACGLILETVSLGRRELKRMVYLSLEGVNLRPARGLFASAGSESGSSE
jgi:glycosyltransferase involved in cell wall biosynthesis